MSKPIKANLTVRNGSLVEYCDHCGEPLKGSERMVHPSCPYDTASTNAGESCVLCFLCDEQLANSP